VHVDPAAPADAHRIRDLAIAWMNRGHEWMLRGDTDALTHALEAYGEAIARLRPLVCSSPVDPAWINSLGAALMNRGQLLHRLHGTTQAMLALQAFDEAAAHLRSLNDQSHPWPRRNLAGTLLNRANLLSDLGRSHDAQLAAREALDLAAPHERNDLVDADLGLKARRTLCDALGQLIVQPGADQPALAREASDLVEAGLQLAGYWTARGGPHPHELALRLFRFGARLYRINQPHFLVEFLEEHLAPRPDDPAMRAVAREEIDVALAARPTTPYLVAHDPATERQLQLWRDLEAARARLTA
jgi:tetratricopeptide (TPR) repeat protein